MARASARLSCRRGERAMKIFSRVTFLLILLNHAAPALLSQEERSLIPIETFFRPAKITRTTLSPDGRYGAGLAPMDEGDEIGLVLIDLDTMEPDGYKWFSGFDVYSYHWVNETDVIFSVAEWNAYVEGLFRINRSKRKIVTLMGNDVVARMVDPMTDDPLYSWIWLMRTGPGSNDALVKIRKKARAQRRSVVGSGVDVDSYSVIDATVTPPTGEIFGWIIDWAGVPRIVLRSYRKQLQYMHRDAKDGTWEALPIDPEEWRIVNFNKDNRLLFVTGYHGEQTRGLYLYDMEKNAVEELVFRDDEYDYTGTGEHRFLKDILVGITYYRDRPASVWFLPQLQSIQALVDRAIPTRINIISHWSDDFRRFLVGSYSDTAPVSYFLFDLAKRKLELITESAPWLDDTKLARTSVLHFTTSDGLRLEGYLTTPNGLEAPYPMVCLVHGGPWARDTGGYNAEAQFLANRGCAVLRVNYRGSSGYAKAISEDPRFDFRKMHDDITEAVKLTVKQGIADPDRLAIMGASFGGYAALCGAAFEPDLYKCAVTVVGVFDLEMVVKARKRQDHFYSHSKLKEELGDPKTAAARFEEISPIHHVDRIKIPIFIAHGKNDRNVDIRQSRQLQGALKQRNIPHETFYRQWEGRGFFHQKNRIEMYRKIEGFLERHL